MVTPRTVKPPAARKRAGPVERATKKTLARLAESGCDDRDVWDALSAQAVVLAQLLDYGAGLGTAVAAKQHAAVLLQLEGPLAPVQQGTSPLDDLRASWGRPVLSAVRDETMGA